VPSLDLCFADKKDLICASSGRQLVTFARASSGTYVDSAGVLSTATTNLLLQSEDFGTTWFLTSATLSANAIAAPNGTLTAEQLVEAATTANHEAGQTFASPVANATYTLSCYLKAATSTTCGIRFSNGLNGTGIICSVDLTAQTVTVTAGTGTATIANVGSGWFRVSLTATASGTPASTTVSIFRSIGTAGSIANSIYLWGAQLEQSSTVGEYIPTGSTINSAPRFDHNPLTGESLGLLVEEQRTNLVLRSEEFEATWTLTALNATVSANQTTAPNGATTADSIADDAVNNVHYIGQSVAVAAATTYTFSCFLRAGTSNFGYLSLSGGGPGWGDTFVVNLSTGVGNVQAGSFGSTSIQAFADGWYRVVVTKITTGSGSPQLRIGVAQSLSVTSYSGSGNTIFAWGAQLEQGASASSYIPTTTAAATRNASLADLISSAIANNIRSFYVEFSSPAVGTRGAASLNDNTANKRIEVITSGTDPRLVVRDGGVEQANINGGTVTAGVKTRVAVRISANDFAISINGSTAATDTSGTLPTVDRLMIGRTQAGEYLNGRIARFAGWTELLSDVTLQAITQP
jgi:hypothetical protein